MPPEPLDAEDARILGLETPTIAGHTCKIAIIEQRAGVSPLTDLRTSLAARIARVPRCRQRVVHASQLGGAPCWADDDSFSVATHVNAVCSGEVVTRSRLLEIAGEVMARRLDRDRPLWRIDVVEALDDGTWALLWTLHHCMADGVTAMRWATELLWDEQPAVGPDPRPQAQPPAARSVVEARWRRAAALAEHAPGVMFRELRPVEERSPFDGRVGTTRAVGFAHCRLDDLRRIEQGAGDGTTINDVLLAVVAGGIRRWLAGRGAALHTVRIKVPVSMHSTGTASDRLGNRDSFMFVDVGLVESDPFARLRAVHKETSERKHRGDPQTMFTVLEALDRVAPVGRLATRLTMSPHEFTLNVSNVPGPREQRSVLGGRVRELYSLAEIAPHHALRVSALSLAGSMFIGLNTDPRLVADVDELAAGVEASVEELLAT